MRSPQIRRTQRLGWVRDRTFNCSATDPSTTVDQAHQPALRLGDADSSVLEVQDRFHERHIQQLSTQYLEARQTGDMLDRRRRWIALCEAINARSPGQVERMERRMELS